MRRRCVLNSTGPGLVPAAGMGGVQLARVILGFRFCLPLWHRRVGVFVFHYRGAVVFVFFHEAFEFGFHVGDDGGVGGVFIDAL